MSDASDPTTEAALVKATAPLQAAWTYLNAPESSALLERADFFLKRSDDVERVIDSVRGKSVFLLHGVTGVGKSTLTLRLKTNMSPDDFLEMVWDASESLGPQTKETDDGLKIALGDGHTGTTIVPNRIDVNDAIILDMPGLQDNDPRHVFSIGVVHKLLMRDMARCQIACVVPLGVFTDPSQLLQWMDAWREALRRMLGESLAAYRAGMECVTFILNRVDVVMEDGNEDFDEDKSYEHMCDATRKLLHKCIAAAVNNAFNLRLLQQVQKSFVLVDYSRHDAAFVAQKLKEASQKVAEGQLRQASYDSFGHVGSKEQRECQAAMRVLDAARKGVLSAVHERAADAKRRIEQYKKTMQERSDIISAAVAKVSEATTRVSKVDVEIRKATSVIMRETQNQQTHVADVKRRQRSLDFVLNDKEGAGQVYELRCVVVRSHSMPNRKHEAHLTAGVAASNVVVAFSGDDGELRRAFQSGVGSRQQLQQVLANWRERRSGADSPAAGPGRSTIIYDTATNSVPPDRTFILNSSAKDGSGAAVSLSAVYNSPFTLCVFYNAPSKARTVQVLRRGLEAAKQTQKAGVMRTNESRALQQKRRKEREQLATKRQDAIDKLQEDLRDWQSRLDEQQQNAMVPVQEAQALLSNLSRLETENLWLAANETVMFLRDHMQGGSDMSQAVGIDLTGTGSSGGSKGKKNSTQRKGRRGRQVRMKDAAETVRASGEDCQNEIKAALEACVAPFRKLVEEASSPAFLVTPTFPPLPALKLSRAEKMQKA
eukprot:CAMPEP_0195508888 /NCGR_PEP_ID=MMETSP0794_2-20130614/1979_1 /TAXON_ID=515487 /ORGANISM="Stephanopyxis turris, Strain CCMP 815" /LENGTH=770 /DNA_ID=CAMNT_0040635975 /DNA_START=150 /DNA_END=2462 /DNA_ORIENTATION=+